ncbi:efflux RND transporter permease subunit [Brevundimonas subvibrioides]|uniref:efflux RND transporter permease subunit n=1 Tax=Brevundimonas subvibrioides TaxID=74313 RepID=UPI0022B43AC3|nr:efflux RND transporter permease subunit [Brevundimonas subvibrioides]
MSLTQIAVKRSRFTLIAALALFLAGLAALFGFPATEEPTVPFRAATVEAYLPGATPQRMESLIARPLEERIRTVAEVKKIETTVRPGALFMTVTLHAATPPDRVDAVWQKLRARAGEAAGQFPQGTVGPVINDSWGRVSVLTLALSGEQYSAGQLQEFARMTRLRLQAVPGVDQISLHGVREEQIYVEVSPSALATAGLKMDAIVKAISDRNAVAAAGEIDVSGRTVTLYASGSLADASAVGAVPVALADGTSVPLSTLAAIKQQPQDPPVSAVVMDGKPAVVLGVSMQPGLNVIGFAQAVNAEVKEIQAELPVGMSLTPITDQADVVSHSLMKVGKIFLETVAVVLGVVVVFLGWRAGLVTSVIVPLTVLGTMLIMRALKIELHQVSIGAIIIALGIFVDNAIVVVEDYQRRIGDGEQPTSAAVAAGRTMAAPLLVSSLAIILAFAPLVAGSNGVSEYMRSLAIVLGITLLLSLFLALTVIALLCRMYIKVPHGDHEKTDWIGRIKTWYARKVRLIVARPGLVILAMAALLTLAVGLNSLLPQSLLPPSERDQVQIPIELSPGSSSRATLDLAQAISARIGNRAVHPDVVGNVIYVGDGGPRFILGLNPPTPASHRAYAIVNLAPGTNRDAAVEALRSDLAQRFPQARLQPKRFSLGASEAGKAVFILSGPDRAALERAADVLKAGLRNIPGIEDVRDDAEGLIPRLVIDIDPARAEAAGVTPIDAAQALQAAYSGVTVTTLSRGDLLTPVILRADPSMRLAPESVGMTPVREGVALADIATIRIADQDSVLNRRDQRSAITVSARHPTMTSQAITDRVAPTVARLEPVPGQTLEMGGEIEESAEANSGLATYFPLALVGMAGLFLWQFGSVRKTIIIMASIPFVLIGATAGLFLTGQEMNFTATLGLLALAGIIVNNAVLLLERVIEERRDGASHIEAVTRAAEVRLRPIVMTKLTCIVGLIPLFLFGGDLWRPMAAAMMGGLALGTLITLVLIPALYALLFERLPTWHRGPASALEIQS